MNRFIIIALLLIFSPVIVMTQQYRLEPLTTDLLCVTTNGSNVAAGGTNGIIMLSNDEGETWKQLYLPENAVVVDIAYTKSGKGFIALADSGRCFYTENNGISWQKSSAPFGSRCIAFGGDSALLCGDNTGKLYKTTLGANDWSQVFDVGASVLDIAEISPYTAIFFTPDALYLATDSYSKNQKLRAIQYVEPVAYTQFHQTPDGYWGFAIGGKLYYSDSILSDWKSFTPDSAANVLILQQGLNTTVLSRMRFNPERHKGRMYLSSKYDIKQQKLLATVNLDSAYSPRLSVKYFPDLPARVTKNIPVITSIQLTSNGNAIVVGIDKMIYKQQSDGSWKQLCLLTDTPSETIIGQPLPNYYFSMGFCYNRTLFGTYGNGVVFMQTSDNGIIWKTPQKDWSDFMELPYPPYLLTTSCNPSGRVLILNREALKDIFYHSTDTLQSFIQLHSDTIVNPSQVSGIFPFNSSLRPFGDSSWFFTHSFQKGSTVKPGWEKLRSVSGFSYNNGVTWKYTIIDSSKFGTPSYLRDNLLFMTIKFPDSIYFDDTLEYSPRFSGGCELWKSSDTLHTHEVIPQPGIHTIDNLKMFNENHGVAFIVFAEKNKEQTAAAFAETFDGGKTWTVIDSSRQRGNYQASSGLSHDSASYIMYESHFTSKGVPNKIYLWKNNGKERTTITVPTDHSHLFPISADTLFYSVPGELYRMILSPATSVEEPKVEDYETSVFLQSPYPNPASATMKIPVWYYAATVKPEDISVKCYDITGAKVADLSRSITRVSDGQLMAEWDMSDIPSGVYIVKSSSTNRRGNTRIVVKAERK